VKALGSPTAYDETGSRWEQGPGRVYNHLAERVVACSPLSLEDRRVLDLGAGTGAASRAIAALGGEPVALDPAFGMLISGRSERPAALQGDALDLPLRTNSLGGVVASFSLNHLTDPVRALREAARVVAAGSPVVVATYASEDAHPVKDAVEGALRAAGWRPGGWYEAMRSDAIPLMASSERVLEVAGRAGLHARCDELHIPFPDLSIDDLISWRLGMAQHAPFVAGLDAATVERLRADTLERLDLPHPALVRSILVLTAVV
jgi:ubiquinone/menaquinone biosynthesis C-methylase UbiE